MSLPFEGRIRVSSVLTSGTDPILFRVLRPTLDSNDRGDTGMRSSKRMTKPEEAVRLEYGEAQEGVPTNSGRVLLDRALCFSLRHGRSDVDSVRRNVEFGIVLLHTSTEHRSLSDLHQHPPEASTTASVFDGWARGDMIQCFRIVKRPQSLEWHIDHPPTSEI